jgi:acyl carrier protein
VTRGYFEDAAINAELITSDGWLNTGDLGLKVDGEFYITGRAKDIIFVAGQNYYPHDLEAIAQHAKDLDLNKVVVAAVRKPDAENDEIAVFVLHRGAVEEFADVALQVSHLINEHAGLEVQHVIPVKRIPKTTSGKLQRHLLAEAFVAGEFDADLEALRPLLKAKQQHGGTPASAIAQRLKSICDAVMADRSIGTEDNLFDVGVSSLKLVEIHENIDREFPGQLDLTEIFDHPTIAQMATYLEQKAAAVQ